jgi:adenylate cyclase
MTEEIFANDGVVDKFIGDSVMAFWGAPIEQLNQADRAVRTAISMMERLKKLQEKWNEQRYPFVSIGIGISTGVAIVGNIGSEKRFDYTVIGDEVNVAARLEGLNKEYNSNIIISNSTRKRLSISVKLEDLGDVSIKGIKHPIKIYKICI